jgi:hypothetical protein
MLRAIRARRLKTHVNGLAGAVIAVATDPGTRVEAHLVAWNRIDRVVMEDFYEPTFDNYLGRGADALILAINDGKIPIVGFSIDPWCCYSLESGSTICVALRLAGLFVDLCREVKDQWLPRFTESNLGVLIRRSSSLLTSTRIFAAG